MKDKDFILLNEAERITFAYKLDKDGLPTDKVDVYKTISINREKLTQDDIKELLQTYDMQGFIKSFGNVDKFLSSWENTDSKCNVIYTPEYFGKDEKGRTWLEQANIDVITSWVENNLKILADNNTGAGGRKNCLVIFSRRCVGKTFFVEHGLVDNLDYICKFTNGLVDVKPTVEPRIVVMDDVEVDDIKSHRQIYKQLICGQPCTINCKYGNRKFDFKYNPIILTNSAYLLDFLNNDRDFNPYLQIVQISRHEIMCSPEKLFQRDTKPKSNMLPSTFAILNRKGDSHDPIDTKEGYLLAREKYYETGEEPNDFVTIYETEKRKWTEKANACQRQAGIYFNTHYDAPQKNRSSSNKPFENKNNYHYS